MKILLLLALTGCGAGQAPAEPAVKLAPATQTQWCTVATNVGNACPKGTP